ncbi:Pre-rRNA-processing protein ipi3 [Knufia peltigerae]|uniref:Pre-rRNA-processing protein IPI3 n=1 Tax=Knufia peltigerae TaxID=1002370 RepID=A0AA39CYR2_9EURO|nr:Pre-rRNA-processing protein ipi3 [Knufia peltigerae]
MLTESFVAATLTANKAVAHASAALRDVGIFLHEFQPHSGVRHGYKKSSSRPGGIAISSSHIFAAQADKAVVNVYSRERGNQEATVPFPERIHSLAYAHGAEILVLGTEGGKLILWEVATGRLTTSSASHLQAVSSICITPNNEYILSGSADTTVHIWSLLKLVSFLQPASTFGTEEPSHLPVQTFSAHRATVNTITCGHSKINTNFAVSASSDRTCYVWHIDSCQVIRTLLLPSSAISVTIDPADRAIYFGCDDGQIQSFDIYHCRDQIQASTSNASDLPPIQLLAKESWVAPSSDLGAASCLTLSYDGTSLLSGHRNGAIIRWDCGKRRITNEVSNLAQPVTSIQMLDPEGFLRRNVPSYTITNVVKPNLDFAASKDNGTCGIPAKYNLHVKLGPNKAVHADGFVDEAILGHGFPQDLFDDALRSLTGASHGTSTTSLDGSELGKVERLEDEVSRLKEQLRVLHNVEQKRKERNLARLERQDEVDLEKRKAYFEAKKKGQDGDLAIKTFEDRRSMLRTSSDEDDSDVQMDVT